MTTIINAVSGTGITQTADGSGVMKLQSNGVTTNALAWARATWNGTTLSVNASYNISSITRTAAGNFTASFASSLADANYSFCGSVTTSTSLQTYLFYEDARLGTRTSSIVYFATATTAAYQDASAFSLAVFGN